ncbi:MAG TPA: NAD(P)-dependent methylenetetrahydromethanopterin dehydrogenase [Acidobacteriota bacterium]|nr:NAD(P)-dependent methylenetetrahydromethanopterin dehydrogenase [Acidobacteriota bacterium]
MKKILIQLDSDRCAAVFDCIVAHDAGVDVVQSLSGVKPEEVRGLLLGAVFTRSVKHLHTLAAWIGGSDVDAGEKMLDAARRSFFGPFRISVMLDSNGCNTTASTAVARLAKQTGLGGKKALVIGQGAVGVRTAILLALEGCMVSLSSIPVSLFGETFNSDLAVRTAESCRRTVGTFAATRETSCGGSIVTVTADSAEELKSLLERVEIVAAAGPAGLRILESDVWLRQPNLKWLLDFNLTEPLGIEGVRPADDFALYDGKRAMGALAVGNDKMRVHKACIEKLFERNDLVLDAEGVYTIAKQLL